MNHLSSTSKSHTLIHGWLLHHFFTGNMRALEVARETVGGYLENGLEPSGVLSNRHSLLRREFVNPLSCLFAYYQVTWEERIIDCASKSLDLYLKTAMECAKDSESADLVFSGFKWPRDVFTSGENGDIMTVGGGFEGGVADMDPVLLPDAYLLLREPVILDAIISLADHYTQDPGNPEMKFREFRNTCPVLISFAYIQTGNERYAKALTHVLGLFPQKARRIGEMKEIVPFQRAHDVPQSVFAMLSALRKYRGLDL